ncbi:MAG: serine/threonine-protein kinase [Vicinamibacterales bacterium]
MAEDDSRLIRHLYAGALQRDPEERDEYLDEACADRPDLRARVLALLEAHSQDFLDATTASTTELSARRPSGGPASGELEGRKVGNYIIRREIGRGGMGVVYLADDTLLPRRVALKALNPGFSQTPALRERLRNEARLAAALAHPGIATVYALEEIDGELYIACEFVPGAPLRALLKSGPLPVEQVVDIGLQVARALAEAHTHGIVHRDLKPENVMKTPSGLVKILDFGLARAEQSTQPRLTQTGMIVGTPAYLAPEQALGQRTDFRTDLFALGLLLYELASGMNPFAAKSVTATIARIVEEDPPPLSEVQPRSRPDLERIVELCLRKDPRERYGSTQEVVAELERLHTELIRLRLTPSSGIPATPVRPQPGAKAWQWLAIHQLIVSAIYLAMLYPVWYARAWLPAPWGLLFLLGVLATAAAATSLRLHLCFTARAFPHLLAAQQAWTWRRTRLCDLAFAAAQIGAALVIGGGHPEFAMLFVGVSTAVLVATFVIEPATAGASLSERADVA